MSNNNIANTRLEDWVSGWILKALPWVAAPIIFFMVCHHFFAPQFEDKVLSQGDIAEYKGMSHDIREHREAMGEDPQWTGNMFSGMPAYLIDMEYPTQDVKQSIGQVVKIMDEPMNIIFFAMMLMMVAVVLMGVNPWIGIIAGLAYGLSTYFFLIIDAGHITKAWAMVYAPPLVGAVWYALRKNMWTGGVLAALFGSLELGANHPQITYYFLLVCAALWLSEMWFTYRDKAWRNFGKRTAILAVAALLAGASNFAPLWYAASHQKHTVRGMVDENKSATQARKEHIDWNTQWSYGKAESFNMLVPNYMCALPVAEQGVTDKELALLNSNDAQIFFTENAYNYANEKFVNAIPKKVHNEAIREIIDGTQTALSAKKLERLIVTSDEAFNLYLDRCSNILVETQGESVKANIPQDIHASAIAKIKADIEAGGNQLSTPEVEELVANNSDMCYGYLTECYQALAQEGNIERNTPIYQTSYSLYWGDQPFTAGPTYLGIVVAFLAILGIITTTGRNRWWLIAITIFAIFLAWGKNMMWFYELMYDMLPGYKSYRTVSMALVIVEWSAVVMAAYALMALWRNDISTRRLMWGTISTTIIILMMIVMMGAMTDYGASKLGNAADTWWGAQIQEANYNARHDAFMEDAWRAVGYILLTATTIIAYIWAKNRDIKESIIRKALPYTMLLIIGGIMVCDLIGVDNRYFNDKSWHDATAVTRSTITPTAEDKQIMKDKEPGFRVFDLTHQGRAYASNFHRSVDGYHGAKLGRYDEVLNNYIYTLNDNVLSMLNVKYLIVEEQGRDVVPNQRLGAAWLVESPKQMESAKEVFEAIGHEELGKYAIVGPSAPKLKPKYSTAGSIRLVEYAPNYLRYEYNSAEEALAVFSEIYYPDGWKVYVDDKEVDYFSVDYILRGMELPAGKHTIEWEFRAPNWGMATAITGIGSWLIIIALVLLLTSPLWRRYLLPSIKASFNNIKNKR